MSGLAADIPPWTMDQHEVMFQAVCRHFGIDSSAVDVMDRLRAIPQQVLADETPAIQGVLAGTGNPCLDGWFYADGVDPREINEPPHWIQSFMIGDTYHEGIIFHINILDDGYDFIRNTLLEYVQDEGELDTILEEYGITPDLAQETLVQRMEHMVGDAVFKIPNYTTILASQKLREAGNLFAYHFDQRSRLKNTLEGTSYHAHDLLYLFGNLHNKFDDGEKQMARDFASAFLRFVYGEAPWEIPGDEWKWKVWGPDSKQALKNENEDESVRSYTRIKRVIALGNGQTWMRWLKGVDVLINKRMRVKSVHSVPGTF